MVPYAKLQYTNGKNIITLASEELKASAQRDLTQYAMLSEQAEDYAEKANTSDISPEAKQFYQKQLKSLTYRLECYNDYLYKSYGFYPIGVDTLEDISKYNFIVKDALAAKIHQTSFYSDLETIEQDVAVMEKEIHEAIVDTNTTQETALQFLPEFDTPETDAKEQLDSTIQKVTNTAIDQYGETLDAVSKAEKAYLLSGSQYKTAITQAYDLGNTALSYDVKAFQSAQEDLLGICKEYSECYKKSGSKLKKLIDMAKQNYIRIAQDMTYTKDVCVNACSLGAYTEARRNQMYKIIDGYAEAIKDYNDLYAEMALVMREKVKHPTDKAIRKAYDSCKKQYDFAKKMRSKFEKALQSNYMMGCTTKESVDAYLNTVQAEVWGTDKDGKAYNAPAQLMKQKFIKFAENTSLNMRMATLQTKVATYDLQIDVAMDITGNVDRAIDKLEEKINLLQHTETEYKQVKEKLEACVRKLSAFEPYEKEKYQADQRKMENLRMLKSIPNPTKQQKNQIEDLIDDLENDKYLFDKEQNKIARDYKKEEIALTEEYYELSKKWAKIKGNLETVNDKYSKLEERLSEIPEESLEKE